jgi:hypothetical protein
MAAVMALRLRGIGRDRDGCGDRQQAERQQTPARGRSDCTEHEIPRPPTISRRSITQRCQMVEQHSQGHFVSAPARIIA